MKNKLEQAKRRLMKAKLRSSGLAKKKLKEEKGISDLKKKSKTKIKILGTHFSNNREQMSYINLIKIEELANEYEDGRGKLKKNILGKIIIVNTIIYSLIYHKALVIQPKGDKFDKLQQSIGRYIFLNPDMIEIVEAGELAMINIKKRLDAITLKHLINANYDAPETDNIKYFMTGQAGYIFKEREKQIHAELVTQRYKRMVKIYKEKHEELQNLEKMSTKEIQDIIYPEKKYKWPYRQI